MRSGPATARGAKATRLLPAFFAIVAFFVMGPPAQAAADRERTDLPYTYTVAPFVPEYEPPAPGSYELAVIDTLADHPVLDSTGAPRRLWEVKKDRLAVLALIYTSCVEATGCPLASAVLQRLDRELAKEPALARRVRLLSLSFDPERDTPERLARVRSLHEPRTDWIFLTTPNEIALRPILADLGQQVTKLRRADGSWSGLYRHVLKCYLLDEENRVRNIYSTGFLHAELVLTDLRTLLMAGAKARGD